ncbi:MAG TPA: hypothetical protein VD996_01950, partial [Chitinophagaceae bacterium]|nr:hypothetical protein [Chitinophagaceae bacterium]
MSAPAVNTNLIAVITPRQAWHYRVVPAQAVNGSMSFYADRESAYAGLPDELELLTGKSIRIEKIDSITIQQLLEQYYENEQADARQQNVFYQGSADGFLQHLISEARQLKSSDIHLETFEEKCRVRIRIDGMLIQRYLLDKQQYPSLI